MMQMSYPCEIKEEATRPTLSIRFRSPVQELPKHFERVYTAIPEYLRALGEQHTGAPYAVYYNMDMQNLDVAAGFPVSKRLAGKGDIHAGEIPGGKFAVCHYTGPYDQNGPAWEALTRFITENGYTIGGAYYEFYLSEPNVPPQEIKTDLVVPVIRVAAKV